MLKRHYPAEIKLFIIAIPLINAFNYYLTYDNIQLNGRMLFTFTLDTVQGFVAWGAIHLIIRYLDKKIPFEHNLSKRIFTQILLTTFTGIFLIVVMTLIAHQFFGKGAIPLSFFTFDILIISVWFLVINGVYISLYFYRQWKQAETLRSEESRIRSDKFKVTSGKQEIHLNYADIALFIVDGEYITVNSVTGKKYLTDQSLDKIEKITPAELFFRVNRQCLIHRNSIEGFERGDNGKLILVTSVRLQTSEPLTISRTKAAAFRQWFRPETTLQGEN